MGDVFERGAGEPFHDVDLFVLAGADFIGEDGTKLRVAGVFGKRSFIWVRTMSED